MVGTTIFGFMFFGAWREARETLTNLDSKITLIASKPTEIVASDGKTILYTATSEFREKVDFKDIPKRIVVTTLAAEDKRFMEHNGVDAVALGRVLFLAAKEGEFTQGGSTLTMQMAKRLYSSSERTFDRKMRDIALALNMEKLLTKEQIIELYLNQVFYGNGAYGIKAAAKVYFNKELDKLTLSEAALLARLVRTPSRSNPYQNMAAALQGRDTVLKVLLDEGLIDQTKYAGALREKVKLAPRRFGSGERIVSSPYFVRYVIDQLKRDLPDIDIETGGYRIETTLDPKLQAKAEKHVSDFVRKYRQSKITTAASLVMDDEGRVLAMVGGVDFARNEYNVIVQGRRQPGSSFKPFVYAAALSSGAIGPRDRISNAKFTWTDPSSGKVWAPKNSGGGYGGSYSLRDAVAWSKNVPAVRVAEAATPQLVATYARDLFGFTTPIDPVLSIALGTSAVSPLEMAQAYSVFQLNGSRSTPFGVTRVIGPDGKVVKVYGPSIRTNSLDPAVAAQVDSYLRAVVTGGTGRRASNIEDARGKTGTTQDNRDAWFCGYTNNLVCISWVASERYDPKHRPPWFYEPMPRVFGGTYTIELWRDVMEDAQKLYGRGTEIERQLMDSSDSRITVRSREEEESVDDVNPDNEDVPGAPSADEAQLPSQDPADHPIGVPSQTPVASPPADDPPTDPEPDEPTEPPSEETTSFEICAETSLKATIYCPETVTRKFKRDQEPKRWCRLHGGH